MWANGKEQIKVSLYVLWVELSEGLDAMQVCLVGGDMAFSFG